MKAKNPKINAGLTELIEKAADFHGHLGPFLVIGVRMGNTAERILNTNAMQHKKLEATVKIPLLTPFSCVLDGIQVTTHCTVGNQKLRIENSQKEIAACFELQNSDRKLKVSVNPKIVEELMNEISEGASNEELAQKIASMPENQLFTIGKQ
jgi:formylmethanofuran dehydrogenase subunit E